MIPTNEDGKSGIITPPSTSSRRHEGSPSGNAISRGQSAGCDNSNRSGSSALISKRNRNTSNENQGENDEDEYDAKDVRANEDGASGGANSEVELRLSVRRGIGILSFRFFNSLT